MIKKSSFWHYLFSGPFATIFASVATTFIIAAFFFKLVGPVPISVSQTTVEKQSTFDVNGQGEATAIPDEAKINLGIGVEKTTVSEAQKEVNIIIKQIVEALKDLGIKKEAIKTTNYSLYPRYDRRRVISYSANATIQVTLTDFDKLNQAIDQATSLGANQIGNVQFSLSEAKEEELKKEAYQEAINQAKRKAEDLAKLSGIKLGKIINVKEEIQYPSLPRPMLLEKAEIEPEEATQIEPGSTQLGVKITLSYETL